MYDGYLQLDGDELANIARFKAYIEAAPGFPWVKDIPQAEADALRTALGDAPYTSPAADNAPWYDPGDPASANFWGLYVTGISGDEDSTRESSSTQSIGPGGTNSVPRKATRQMRIKALLAARDELAMESGMRWLERVLDPGDCADDGCGEMTLCGYAAVPGYLDTCEGWDYAAPLLRRNEIVDPMFVNGGTYWTLSGGASGVFNPGAQFANLQFQAAITNGVSLLFNATPIPAAAGAVVSGRMTITNRSAFAVSFYAQIFGYTAGGTTGVGIAGSGSTVTIAPGATQTLVVDGAVLPATSDSYRLILRSGAAAAAGATLLISQAQAVQEAKAGAFFYGGAAAADGYSNVWVGQPNASASLQFRAGVDPARHLNEVTVISGPEVGTKRSFPAGVVREVEFGIEAGTPWFYTEPLNVIDSTTAAAGYSDYYDYGQLVATNYMYDPRGLTAANWKSGSGGTLTFGFTSPIGGVPDFARIDATTVDFRCMRLVATATVAGIDVYAKGATIPAMKSITAGKRYTFSVYASSMFFTGSFIPRIEWYDATGAVVISNVFSRISLDTSNSDPALATYSRYSFTAQAPVGAVYGSLVLSFAGTNGASLVSGNTFYFGWWQIEDAVTLPNQPADAPTPWFDGNSSDNYYIRIGFPPVPQNRNTFYWQGSANASASMHFLNWMCGYTLLNGRYVSPDTNPLKDPLAGAVPPPPSPPAITPTIPVVGLTGWNRAYFRIPAIGSAESAISVPIVNLSITPASSQFPDETSTRQLRLRFFMNPGNLDPSLIDPCSYCAELIVSYVTGGTAFTLDGEIQRVIATLYGTTQVPADGYVYGTDGGPVTWPELTCGIPIVMTVDQPKNVTKTVNVKVDLARRA